MNEDRYSEINISVVGCNKSGPRKAVGDRLLQALREQPSGAAPLIQVRIEHEKENPFDANALAVYWENEQLGYVSKDTYGALWANFSFQNPLEERWYIDEIGFDADQSLRWLELGSELGVSLMGANANNS